MPANIRDCTHEPRHHSPGPIWATYCMRIPLGDIRRYGQSNQRRSHQHEDGLHVAGPTRNPRVPARRSLAHHIRRIFANIRAEYSANLREDGLPEVLLLLRARAVVATREAMRLAPKLVNLRASKQASK